MQRQVLLVLFVCALGVGLSPGCKVNKLAEEVEVRDYYIENQLFVQLTSMEKQSQLESDYAKYNLKVVKEVSSILKMIMVEFDTDKINMQKMKVKLEMEEYITSTDFAKDARGK